MFIYNLDSNYKRRYDNVSESKIWGLSSDYLNQINSSLFDVRDYETFEPTNDFDEEIEFEGFEQIDMEVLDATIASQEIYSFVKKYNGEIENRKEIRLIVQRNNVG